MKPFQNNLPSCKPIDKKIGQFSEAQLLVYNDLKSLLLNYLKKRPASNVLIYNWDALSWHNIIANMVDQLWNNPATTTDCYMVDPVLSTGSMNVSAVEWRHDGTQGMRLRATEGKKHRVAVYRLTAALQHPERLLELQRGSTEKSHELQFAHRCKHDAAGKSSCSPCFNPRHGVLTGDAENKAMDKCWNGTAALCPHEPVCIWTDKRGRQMPCRNNADAPLTSCNHSPSCLDQAGWTK